MAKTDFTTSREKEFQFEINECSKEDCANAEIADTDGLKIDQVREEVPEFDIVDETDVCVHYITDGVLFCTECLGSWSSSRLEDCVGEDFTVHTYKIDIARTVHRVTENENTYDNRVTSLILGTIFAPTIVAASSAAFLISLVTSHFDDDHIRNAFFDGALAAFLGMTAWLLLFDIITITV